MTTAGTSLTVWLPDLDMENQHDHKDALALAAALTRRGISVREELDPRREPDAMLVGTWKHYPLAAATRTKFPSLPIIHYCWDLYPFQMNEKTDPRTDRLRRARPTPNATRWAEYADHVRRDATEVWVPSRGVVRRVEEYCGGDVPCKVVPCNAYLWDMDVDTDWRTVSGVDLSREYVFDVMRGYTGEPMVGAAARACRRLGIQCIERAARRLTWDEFRCVTARAAVLVSTYGEASTGGLTLLEGYAHGVPVLITDSPMNGAGEYLPEDWPNVHRFKADDEDDLAVMIEFAARHMPMIDEPRSRVERLYGTGAFADRLATELRRVCLGQQ